MCEFTEVKDILKLAGLMNKLQHEGYVQMEQPFLKVPTEQLKKANTARTRLLEKELKVLQQASSQIQAAQANLGTSAATMASKYTNLITHLQGFKKKLEAAHQEEERVIKRLNTRLAHIEEFETIPSLTSPEFERWSRCRLDRVILDYLLRSGHHTTANQLAREHNLMDMADFDLFAQDAKIEAEIKKGQCTQALQWCIENRTTLKKHKSTLEFHLRLQEFIELARKGRFQEAIQYSQKYLHSYYNSHRRELVQSLALLAFPADTDCSPYRQLYAPSRWASLVQKFKRDSYALHALPAQPALVLTLQAGLSALKTPQCEAGSSPHCPVCQKDTFGVLASALPLSHHTNSNLVCRITGKLIDESNPPLVLPNGFVYSTQAVSEQLDLSGYFHDPESGLNYTKDQFKKVYIL